MGQFRDKLCRRLWPLVGCADPGCEQPGLPFDWISTGGKIVIFTGLKSATCRFNRGHIFNQRLCFGQIGDIQNSTCRKSFETGSYNNAENGAATDQPMKTVYKT
ncbi:MAG: hypothetical protein COA78_20090 [Blastopirellula sp.]|nr:MAG: hypothetical protein COA78_20090 [Blastopirellula sp.]